MNLDLSLMDQLHVSSLQKETSQQNGFLISEMTPTSVMLYGLFPQLNALLDMCDPSVLYTDRFVFPRTSEKPNPKQRGSGSLLAPGPSSPGDLWLEEQEKPWIILSQWTKRSGDLRRKNPVLRRLLQVIGGCLERGASFSAAQSSFYCSHAVKAQLIIVLNGIGSWP